MNFRELLCTRFCSDEQTSILRVRYQLTSPCSNRSDRGKRRRGTVYIDFAARTIYLQGKYLPNVQLGGSSNPHYDQRLRAGGSCNRNFANKHPSSIRDASSLRGYIDSGVASSCPSDTENHPQWRLAFPWPDFCRCRLTRDAFPCGYDRVKRTHTEFRARGAGVDILFRTPAGYKSR